MIILSEYYSFKGGIYEKRVLAVLLSAGILLVAVPVEVFAGDVTGMTETAVEEPADSEETAATDGESVQSDEVTEDAGTESGAGERKAASAGIEENFEYTEDNSGITITNYLGKEGEVVIPGQINGKDVVAIGDNAFKDCSSITSITIPDSVTRIKSQAFYYCSSLTNITIPENVTSIEAYAFSGCSSLTSITIPENMTSTGVYAFGGCSSLTSITIPENMTSIARGMFADCSSLTSIKIPNGVTSIGASAFANCSGLMSITIPGSVTSIVITAFQGCTSLQDIYYTGTESQWNAISIEDDIYMEDEIKDLTNATIHYNYSKQEFSDITNTAHPYYTAIYWASSKGITTGFSDGTFKPYDNCTRGQVVTFLWRLAGKPEPSSSAKARFSDMVASSHPYYKAILWAVEKGITTGFNDGTFKPFDNCSRGQIVTFIYRYAGSPSISGKTANFKDMVSSSHPFYSPIVWASTNGITTGFSDNTFGPAQKCTRGQVVTFLYRYSK